MNIKKKQAALLPLLLEIDNLCRENSIKYSLGCGTALGAVREKGFIKWDGDIDIMMSFPEYSKFESLASKLGPKSRWMSYKTDIHTPLFYGRVYPSDVDSEHLEDSCYIDINVYTGAPESNKEAHRMWRISNLCFKIFWVKNRRYINNLRRKKNLIGFLLQLLLIFIPNRLLIRTFSKMVNKYGFEEKDTSLALQGFYGVKEIIPAKWFQKCVDVEFEGHKVMIISEWDAYLKQLYGDYLTPKRYARYN